MGTRYLSNSNNNSRLLLYQRAIHLFHYYRNTKTRKQFQGPFHAVGLRLYRLGPLILDNQGNKFTPDIVSSMTGLWLSFELTNNPSSKEEKLKNYSLLDSNHLGNHGLPYCSGSPEVLSGRVDNISDGNFCQILLQDKLDIRGESHINSQMLRYALLNAKGYDLTALPELPFTILPEMKTLEIRVGISEQVIQLFDPSSQGKRAIEIVKEGLERLDDKISMQDKQSLLDKVERQMNELMNGPLKGYLECEKGVYKMNKALPKDPRGKIVIIDRVKGWAGLEVSKTNATIQSSLLDF